MAQRKKNDQLECIQDISVIDLLLMDHRYIKECIDVFSNDQADKKKKFSLAKSFLDAVQKHSAAEKKAVYSVIESNEELHFSVLEAEIEHGIVDQKVKLLKTKLTKVRTLKDELEAEFKVLAQLVKNHLMEEESELLPKMKEELDDHALARMGEEFMRLRKISPCDITDYPLLQDELIQWKDSVQKLSSQFLTKMDKYMENLKH